MASLIVLSVRGMWMSCLWRSVRRRPSINLKSKLKSNDIAFAVDGGDLRLLPVSLEDIGNVFLMTVPRRSEWSTALHFATNRLLGNGQRVVLVLLRRSPLAEFAQNPNVLGVLGVDAELSDLSELLTEDLENTVIVVDDFDTLTNDHKINPTIGAHVKACRDHPGGVVATCGIDEIGGVYRGVVATARKTRTGLVLAPPRSANDGTRLSARLPRSVGAPSPMAG